MWKVLTITNPLFGAAHTYVLYTPTSQQVIIIDPAGNHLKIIELCREAKWSVIGILITHGHFDHIYGLEVLLDEFPFAQVLIHTNDMECLIDEDANLSTMGIFGVAPYAPFTTIPGNVIGFDTNQVVHLSDCVIQPINLPGHTPGAVIYRIDQVQAYFTGDILFKGTVGRSDFYRSNHQAMNRSLQQLRSELSVHCDYAIYPGHEAPSTVTDELTTNPWLLNL